MDKYPCMREHSNMSTTTISLDRSAYDLLRARKRPEESFSEEIHRLLGSNAPELKGFLTLLSATDATAVADSIEAARAEDLDYERSRARRPKVKRGRRA